MQFAIILLYAVLPALLTQPVPTTPVLSAPAAALTGPCWISCFASCNAFCCLDQYGGSEYVYDPAFGALLLTIKIQQLSLPINCDSATATVSFPY